MYTETDGIVIKKVKLTNGKTLLTVFTQKFGKISAGTGINEKNRTKSGMVIRPFSYSRFEMYKNVNNYNIINGELLESYYKIGEDIDKYVEAAYILEYTDKILIEEKPAPAIYSLLIEYLKMIALRKANYATLSIAYQIKTLKYLGVAPIFKECVLCSSKEGNNYFSIESGGIICEECAKKIQKEQDCKNQNKNESEMLIYPVNFDIIRVMAYILENPLKALDKVKLMKSIETDLRSILKKYLKYHLDIEKLKSESFCWID